MDLETIKTAAIVAIIVVAVLGLLAAIIIRKVIGKVISVVLAAVLIFVGWQQRDKVVEYADSQRAELCVNGVNPDTGTVKFLFIDVDIPEDWCTKR